ncbi:MULTISPECIES: TlpA disulfide reductase family protein [unclassified Micromonospora]|uniref:TlpA family protein disulfide reductase n=1 Tax=unclassified Micromonospora TaxID=2617518 RepID=UPI000EF5036D|nr:MULTISPECIES: TlpA disulfide reductase family protein [unclassified Micromonospora]RLP88114.1 TlpA family protein disulfide reductase [Micromonospora sp. CV4]RLP90905.1 TlpA family protein disulfide reductase [Micromonospora sp. BL4]
MNRRLALLVLPLLLLVAGCTTAADDAPAPRSAAAQRPSPFQDCSKLSTAPQAGAGTAAPGTGGEALPELTLACFTGGAPVALREVAGPAVINVWASWCPPCRKELPAFQRLSERTAGRLQVVGVNNRDSRDGAQSIGEDFGVRFPILVDQGEALQRALKRNAIPLTLFVDAQGRIRHIDTTGALDDARLAELVRQHLGLAVPA